ncbi:MAG: hypothetical protein KF836_13845 [Fimbriimonadaceae bacterium]|nr:hypothetical protein [Fimbriimonadaceae bacterium]
MKKFIKWGLFIIFAVAMAIGLGWVTKMFFGGSENERRAVEQGFHYLPNLAANPEQGVDMAREPAIAPISVGNLVLDAQQDSSLIPLCKELIKSKFPPQNQLDRLTAETTYIFPEPSFEESDPFFASKLNLQNLASALTFRSFVYVAERDFDSAISNMKMVAQISQNLRKSPNMDCLHSADTVIFRRTLNSLCKLAVAHNQDSQVIEYVQNSTNILSARTYPSVSSLLNWHANYQNSFLDSNLLRREHERWVRVGPVVIPIPKKSIRERIFSQYLTNLKIAEKESGGIEKQLIALSHQSAIYDSKIAGGPFQVCEGYVLGGDSFEMLSKIGQPLLVLNCYLDVLKFERLNQRLPNSGEILLPVDPVTGFQIQYIQIPVPDRKRPRVLIISANSNSPFAYHGQYLSSFEPHILEPDPLKVRVKKYFRKDGTEILAHHPDYPNAKAPKFGGTTVAPGIRR